MTVLRRKAKFTCTIILNLGIVYCLVLWLVHNVHLQDLYHDIAAVSLTSICWTLLVGVLVSFLYALRLKFLLRSNLATGWFLIALGNGLNNILPFRLGDLLRIVFAQQNYQIPTNKIIVATFVERFLDLVALLSMAGFPLLFYPQLRGSAISYLLLGLFCCALLAVGVYRLLMQSEGFAQRYLARLSFMHNLKQSLSQVMGLQNKSRLNLVTVGLWFSLVLQYYFFFHGNLSNYPITLAEASVLCFITTLSFAIPYMVAGIGVFESAIIYFLVQFIHVDATQAAALALTYHFVFSLPQILLALGVLVLRKIHHWRPALQR